MNVALLGSVSSSYYTLEALIKGGVEVTCVLGVDESRQASICDYRSIRGLAEEAGIPYLSFIKVSEPAVAEFLRQHRPDMLWVIGISQLVPQELIDLASQGGVGFHPTMLPKGRGRAPVAWTILLDAPAAANLFYLTEEPDAGDIIMQRPVPVLPDDYSEDLIERTNQVLAEMVLELAPAIRSGNIPRTPQDHSQATHYDKRTPADGLIDWSSATDTIYKLIRAAGRPYPGAFTYANGKKLVIWRAQPIHDWGSGQTYPPGTIVEAQFADEVVVATRDGAIRLTEVEFEDGCEPQSVLKAGIQLTNSS